MARGRGVASPRDKEAMRLISKKIKTLLKQKQIKQIELSRGTGIPASTLTGYIKGNSLPVLENMQKIADFFDIDVQELDPRYLSVHSPTPFSLEFTDIFQSLDQSRKQAVTDFAKKELENQTTEERLKDDYFPYKVYESFQTFLNKPEQADIVWLDKELDYDIALWIRTDSLEPKYPQGSVALIKNTHFEFAGAIYAIDYDGQTILKRVFNDPTGIRLISLNKKYSDKFIPHQEEPKVIGRVMAAFMPLDLSEHAQKPL